MVESSAAPLIVDRQGRVAILTLNRPEKLNAISDALHEALMAAIAEVREDDGVWAVVITGAGRAFSAGVDLTGGASSGEDQKTHTALLDDIKWFGRQTLALANLDKPTIAALNGIAVGLGMSISLACDLRVGGAATRFRTMMVERSLGPDSGMSWFLPRVVGYPRAADLLMTSREVDGDEAYRLGLLDRFVGPDDIVAAAVDLADQITRWPPTAVRTSKRMLQRSLMTDLPTALANEVVGLQRAQSAPNDAREALASFVERRPPNFTGT